MPPLSRVFIMFRKSMFALFESYCNIATVHSHQLSSALSKSKMRNLKLLLFLCFVIELSLHVVSTASFGELTDGNDHDSCPIWTVPRVRNGTSTQCQCRRNLNKHHVVLCDMTTHDLSVLLFHCLTYSDAFNRTVPVVGPCLYNLHGSTPPFRNYWKVPVKYRNDTALCLFTESCDYHGDCTYYQHQTGLMCTGCEDGYAYPVYSYSIGCVKCTDYKYNWLKYIAVAFSPLTVSYILVVLFRVTATSGVMNGYILMCQLIATPVSARFYARIGPSLSLTTFQALFFSVIGIWNLDFFRALYPPFCLHPKLTTLQTLMLDYVVAVYPLLLVILTYIFVKLHNRYSFVVWLWSPFYKCFALFRNEWDINRSLVGAFATFLLLSYVKILNVSFYALTPNTFHDIEGNEMSKRFLYYDGTYEYFGADHIPYALLAVFMVLVFNIFPLVLLCLYPCRWFQRCLNCCRLRCLALHIFMDTFHGCYKLQPRDCRYFAATYLFLRLLNHSFIALTVGPSYSPLAALMCTFMIAVVATIRPYKSSWHTFVDCIFFVSLTFFFIGISAFRLVEDFNEETHRFYLYTLAIPVVLPSVLYGMGLLAYFVVPKRILLKMKSFFEHFQLVIGRKFAGIAAEEEERLPYRFYHSEEYPPLLLPEQAAAED